VQTQTSKQILNQEKQIHDDVKEQAYSLFFAFGTLQCLFDHDFECLQRLPVLLARIIEQVVVAGVFDPAVHFGVIGGVEEFLSVPEGDGAVLFAVDDKEGAVNLFDAGQIVEFIEGNHRPARHDAIDGDKGAFENQAADRMRRGQPCGRAGADGTAVRNDAGRSDFRIGDKVLISGIDVLIRILLGGPAVAETIASVVIEEDAEALLPAVRANSILWPMSSALP
jgi:hypothetical protein